MTTVAKGPEALRDLQGKHIGWTSWHEVDQKQVNLFADATGDHQWIHVDPERAAKGPFGGAIAHGYLTLSLAPVLLGEFLTVEGMAFGVNYGCNKVRFPSPVKVGSKLAHGSGGHERRRRRRRSPGHLHPDPRDRGIDKALVRRRGRVPLPDLIHTGRDQRGGQLFVRPADSIDSRAPERACKAA